MKIAERISRLGTETAFAVSAEAAAFAAQGNHVYPFHLGDINLPTPSTVVEGAFKAIEDGKLDRLDNPLKNAPHTVAAIGSDNWSHPYTREQAAWPKPWLRDAKFWPSVGRIDNTYGDRHLVCTCPPMESYE